MMAELKLPQTFLALSRKRITFNDFLGILAIKMSLVGALLQAPMPS